MKVILTRFNTEIFSHQKTKETHIYNFTIHTNVKLKLSDIFIQHDLQTKILTIKDLITDDDRDHGDIRNQHIYKIKGKLLT